jgi:hypothetical protein
MFNEDEEILHVVRRHNRILRKVHKVLRRNLQQKQEHADNIFVELCSNNEAQLAMEKLWALGGIQDICGPQDYDKIVDTCLSRLNVVIPIDQS